METRVRFIVVGVFAVVCVVAAFLFVYWIEAAGGLARTRALRVEFQGSASGLRPGAAVQFNGVRIGEVTTLSFNPTRADVVNADLAVDAAAPLRTDSRVSVETQGLLGTTIVAIYGGSAQAGPLGAAPLRAEAAPSLMDQARAALTDVRAVVADNKAPLRNILANADKFSAALGRNADRIDGLVAGLEQFLGRGPKPPPPQYLELVAPDSFPGAPPELKAHVSVAEIGAPAALHTQKVMRRDGSNKPLVLGEAQWMDETPKLIQIKLVEAFENAHLGGEVSRAFDQAAPDFQLMIDLRRFEIDTSARRAIVEFSARLVGKDGRVAQEKLFRSDAPCEVGDGLPASQALSQAFARAAVDLVEWTAAQAR